MESDNKGESTEEEGNAESSKPRWWKPLWIVTAILMVGWGVFSYFFLHSDFVRIVIYEIIFFIVLGIAYYIRVKPSINVNKAIYIALGITPIGFGLWILYAIVCGSTNFCHFLNNLRPYGYLLNIAFQICLFVIGGFIGNWIGKKRDYFLPLSLKKTIGTNKSAKK